MMRLCSPTGHERAQQRDSEGTMLYSRRQQRDSVVQVLLEDEKTTCHTTLEAHVQRYQHSSYEGTMLSYGAQCSGILST